MQEIINDIARMLKNYEERGASLFFKVFDANGNMLNIWDKETKGSKEFTRQIREIPQFSKIELYKSFSNGAKPIYVKQITVPEKSNMFAGMDIANDVYGGLAGYVAKEVQFQTAQTEKSQLQERVLELKTALEELKIENKNLTEQNRRLEKEKWDKDFDIQKLERNTALGSMVVEGIVGFATKKMGITPEMLAGMLAGGDQSAANEHVQIQVGQNSLTQIKGWIDAFAQKNGEAASPFFDKFWVLIQKLNAEPTLIDTLISLVSDTTQQTNTEEYDG